MSEAGHTSTPKRRWLRFSLRTFLGVVALLGVWLGLEVNFVRERQAWIQEHKALVRPLEPVPIGSTVGDYIYAKPAGGFPFWRRWLGADRVPSIVLPEGSTDHDRVRRLFPEAEIGQVATFKS